MKVRELLLEYISRSDFEIAVKKICAKHGITSVKTTTSFDHEHGYLAGTVTIPVFSRNGIYASNSWGQRKSGMDLSALIDDDSISDYIETKEREKNAKKEKITKPVRITPEFLRDLANEFVKDGASGISNKNPSWNSWNSNVKFIPLKDASSLELAPTTPAFGETIGVIYVTIKFGEGKKRNNFDEVFKTEVKIAQAAFEEAIKEFSPKMKYPMWRILLEGYAQFNYENVGLPKFESNGKFHKLSAARIKELRVMEKTAQDALSSLVAKVKERFKEINANSKATKFSITSIKQEFQVINNDKLEQLRAGVESGELKLKYHNDNLITPEMFGKEIWRHSEKYMEIFVLPDIQLTSAKNLKKFNSQ